MENTLYEAFFRNPGLRYELEREAARLRAAEMTIATGGVSQLKDARGMTLHVASGCLWVTQDGSLADTVLEAGESFTITCDGITLLTACKPWPFAHVSVTVPMREPLIHRLGRWIRTPSPATA